MEVTAPPDLLFSPWPRPFARQIIHIPLEAHNFTYRGEFPQSTPRKQILALEAEEINVIFPHHPPIVLFATGLFISLYGTITFSLLERKSFQKLPWRKKIPAKGLCIQINKRDWRQ